MQLRRHQIECTDKIDEHFKDNNKGLVKMFCGSGKSLIIYRSILKHGDNLSVIVVPSISLITQFNRDYLLNEDKQEYNTTNFQKIFDLLTICSKNELSENTSPELTFTTNQDTILNFLEKKEDKVILITYQDINTLFDIIKEYELQINLLCFDEAHHILGDGIKNTLFGTDEDNENDEFNENFIDTYVNKTLFFTATPKNSNGIKMYDPITELSIGDEDYEILDDENTCYSEELHCGKTIYEYMHIDGVNDGILNDFNIRVDLYTENTDESIFEAISRSILESGNNRVLTFHSRSETKSEKGSDVLSFSNEQNLVKFADSFKKILKAEFPNLKGKYKTIDFRGISSSTKNKTEILEDFDNAKDNQIFILASCKTLSEGIDTKNANQIVFIDPKQSYVEIIQNIGRVCRKNVNTKNSSTILIPAYVNVNKYTNCKTQEEKDNIIRNEMSKTGDFNNILNVLSALRQEDPYMFELCLKYSETYTEQEINNNLKKNKLTLDKKKYSKEELFQEYKVKYNVKITEKENFIELSKRINKNIQIVNNKIVEEDIFIDAKTENTLYLVKNDNKYIKTIGDVKHKLNKPNRNIKPFVHCNDEVKILWNIENNTKLDKKIFGGYIKSTVIFTNEEKMLEKWIQNIEIAKKICDQSKIEYKSYFASTTSKNIEERKIGNQLATYRKGISGKQGHKIYLEVNKVIEQVFPLWLKIQSNEDKLIERWKMNISIAKKLCDEKNIKYELFFPSTTSKNMQEKIMGTQLSNYRCAMSGTTTGIVTENVNNLITEIFPLWLKKQTNEEKTIEKWKFYIENAKKICDEQKIKYENYVPSQHSKNKQEKIIGNKLTTYKKNSDNPKDIYVQINKLINDNFVLWLKKKDEEEIAIKKWKKHILTALKICNERKINYNNYIPSVRSNNPEEKKIGADMKHYRQAHNNNGSQVVYESVDELINLEFPHWISSCTANYKKSTTITSKKQKEIIPTESEEHKRNRILSEYQDIGKKISTQNSSTTTQMFKDNPNLWHKYHDNRDISFKEYDNQDEIPVNKIITYLDTLSNRKLKILDLGCGRNLIKIHFANNNKINIIGYDHISFNNSIACDISKLPNEDESIDICVFSQSLMGSNWKEYINEAIRTLRYNGELIISESIERYDIIKNYIDELKLNIKKINHIDTNRWFYLFVTNSTMID